MMRKAVCVSAVIFAITIAWPFPSTAATGARSSTEIVSAAYGVIGRVIPDHEKYFRLRYVPDRGQNDEFRVDARSGIVTVAGNSAIALTHGVYYYLRNAAHAQFTWEGEHIELPSALPDFHSGLIKSPYKYRLYYNVCAFGYTTVFWDWKQWQREIDWMALHGINMPLAMAGQEAIWQRVWERLGLTRSEATGYFTGPAFLPWNRMGNVDSHDGPLPQGYIDKSEALQKRILGRMRELGMYPVVPGFSGYAPKPIERIFPDTRLIAMKPWAGFAPEDGTYMLSPLSIHFAQIGRLFIREYRKTYGYTHFYLADAFNEMTVPVTKEGRYKELAEFGRAIYGSVTAGDPNGVWVMQGWLFHNDSNFWDTSSVKAFLSGVPNDRMIIIDLANESFHGWKKLHGFFGKEWIYSIIHDFGGRNQMFGNLPFYASDPVRMLAAPDHGHLVGFGISPEGTEQNEVVYELLTDMGWTHKRISLRKWIAGYCLSRYGAYPAKMRLAWEDLLKSVYSSQFGGPLYFYQHVPEIGNYNSGLRSAEFEKAVGEFLACSGKMSGNVQYKADAVEMAAQFASTAVDSLLNRAVSAHRERNFAARDSAFSSAFRILAGIDKLMTAHPLFNLKRWVDFARAWGNTPEEENYYESDAKLQITVWGGPNLSEYAAKVWSGLIASYYLKRWERFADSLESGSNYDIREWEMNWINTPMSESNIVAPRDPLQLASQLVEECKRAIGD